jgi:hypothetical protein
MECADERVTQYRGTGHGYGPVRSEERVIFGVFQSTERDGNRVAATTFRNNQLTRYEFSLARLAHITKEEFELNVVNVLVPTQGPLLGIACASVAALRALAYIFQNVACRSVCVVDKVTDLDFDAHTALGYAENQQQLGQKQKSIMRAQIRADLADVFGVFLPIAEVFAHGPTRHG